MNIATIAPIWQRRNAPNSIYPLRGADGLTWAERKSRAALEQHGDEKCKCIMGQLSALWE